MGKILTLIVPVATLATAAGAQQVSVDRFSAQVGADGNPGSVSRTWLVFGHN